MRQRQQEAWQRGRCRSCVSAAGLVCVCLYVCSVSCLVVLVFLVVPAWLSWLGLQGRHASDWLRALEPLPRSYRAVPPAALRYEFICFGIWTAVTVVNQHAYSSEQDTPPTTKAAVVLFRTSSSHSTRTLRTQAGGRAWGRSRRRFALRARRLLRP